MACQFFIESFKVAIKVWRADCLASHCTSCLKLIDLAVDSMRPICVLRDLDPRNWSLIFFLCVCICIAESASFKHIICAINEDIT